MSPRRAFRPARRRASKVRGSTDAIQATRSQAELAADARHEGLAVTHRFDPGSDGQPYAATVRFRGRREGIAGKPQPGDTFTVDERLERVVPGSGPISVTTRAYGLNPGEWTVTAELFRGPGPGPSRATPPRVGQTLPRARWSWLRWKLVDVPFGPVRTRWSPFVRLTAMPAVIHGSWTALVGLGMVIGIGALLWFLSLEGVAVGPGLIVAAATVIGGIVGAKLWYIVLRPRQWRSSLSEGWSIDGSVGAAPIAALAAMLVLDLPVLAVLDAGAPAFFVGVGIGRLGCFLTGCCAGRCTASRWGIWSSDRRTGARRIPTQLMEAGLGIGLAIVFGALDVSGILPVDGLVFVGGLVSYLAGRQLLLRLRADARSSSLGMEGRRRATAV
jgi:phosphatidylglycerol:prolipoprotein diacylglycerol transferase